MSFETWTLRIGEKSTHMGSTIIPVTVGCAPSASVRKQSCEAGPLRYVPGGAGHRVDASGYAKELVPVVGEGVGVQFVPTDHAGPCSHQSSQN